MQRLMHKCLAAVTAVVLIGHVSSAWGDIITYDFVARIDGRDQLIINDGTLQWHHLDYAAVGRMGGNNFPTTISSSLNGEMLMDAVEWIPEWPEPPPDNIRFEAWSSVFADLAPPLPNTEMAVTLRITEARDSLSILEYPTADNDYTLILDFDDNTSGGASWYQGGVTIEYTPVPEPTTLALWLLPLGLVLLYGWRTRRPV